MTSPASTPSRPPSDDEEVGHKSTLFCPDCGHASPLGDDWEVKTVAGHRRVRCPECRHVVDERRSTDRRPARAGAPDDATALDRWADAWNRYWSAWTSLFTGRRADPDY
jgi:hypothetical protein